METEKINIQKRLNIVYLKSEYRHIEKIIKAHLNRINDLQNQKDQILKTLSEIKKS